MHWYFKLFNNIKSEHESADLAKLEIEGLFGEVEPIYNFFDKLREEPLSRFTTPDIRIQDYVLHELPYGRIHGYFGTSNDISALKRLVKRLAYTREIYLVCPQDLVSDVRKIFPDKAFGRIYHLFEKDNTACFRFITYQYFLEKSEYISKLSRNEEEIDRNVEILFSHLMKNLYRIPASSTLSVGKRLEDYFAIREELSLYLTHYFHPYKGKFHPKIARALLNYVCPHERGTVMDNFAGSGTLLVEASLMELHSVGVEINPLSVLMSNVKCNSLFIDVNFLKNEINKYFERVENALKAYRNMKNGQSCLTFCTSESLCTEFFKDLKNLREFERKAKRLAADIDMRNRDEVVPLVLICRDLLKTVEDENVRDFLLLALSGAISDVARRTKADFEQVFRKRVNDLYLRLYLFHKLNEILQLKTGKSKTYEGDAREMPIESNSIDAIVNSPPYSVALDYIKNDLPQLVLLELTKSLKELERKMIGNPRVKCEIEEIQAQRNILPERANKIVDYFIRNNRKMGIMICKFFIDMHKALKEMHRVLKKEGRCAIIIGNNHFKVGDDRVEVPNDEILAEIAVETGFTVEKFIKRELHKSSEGDIREESVIILRK